MIFSVLVGLFYSNRKKTGLLIAGMVLGRLIFLFSFLINGAGMYLLVLFFYYSVYSVQSPVFNSFFQKHLGQKRGQVFGLSRMVMMLCSMLAALAAGKLLDVSPLYYKPILFSVAVTGAVTYILYIIMDRQTEYPRQSPAYIREALRDYTAMFKRADFLMFEAVFMIYGLAFMIMLPAVPLFLINKLKFTYFQMAQANGVYAQLFMLLLIPFAGVIYDKVNLWRVWTFSLAIMLGYPLLMGLSYLAQSKALAYGSLLFYSLGLTGVMILWNLGSLHFSRDKDAFIYQGFHVTMTGVRGVVGPMLGYLLLSRVSFLANFTVSFVLLAGALSLSLYCGRKYRG
ncbi:MAG: MFS transporter, partial [bacterium]|nr:MFS transporter [bacterium]